MKHLASITLALAVLSGAVLHAQRPRDVVFVVRHAERADGGAASRSMTAAPDPALSAAGRARAKALASLLRVARVARIYATEFKRTRQTAEPLAAAAALEIATLPARDIDGLVQRIVEEAGAGPALVVGHSNTVPAILQALGVADPPAIADDEYDNLFVVVREPSGPATLIALEF